MQLATFAKDQIEKSIQTCRLRTLKTSNRLDGIYVIRNGNKLISFSCNDYLGLSNHSNVKQAAIDATLKYGTSNSASRLITGNNPLYEELEKILSQIKGTQSALVFGSGFLVNIGIIPVFVGKGDLIIADKLVHASIIDGCKLSGAKLLRFTHNDPPSCKNLLTKHRNNYKNCLIITETIFSMDGDIAPIEQLCIIAENFDAWIMSDDAHGLGIIANINAPSSLSKKPDLQMGTLSKAVGSYGGYVCADKVIIDYLINSVRSLLYSTALPPATLAASIASLKIILDNKDLCKKPLENAILFSKLMGMDTAKSPIVPLILGSQQKAIMASKNLEDKGFLVTAIRPPTVPNGTSRLRFAFSALHKTEDIEKLVQAIEG